MTIDTVKEKFADVMQEQFGIGDTELKPETSFEDDLALDSLDRITLVSDLEAEFQIIIEDDEVESAGTVQQMLDIIHAKVKDD